MARSIQTVVSSGSLVILGVTLDYYERDDITVYFDDVAQLAGWGWVGTTDKTIVFDPAVPAGVTVKLQRRTDVDRMKHVFTSGAQFKNTNVDTNFLQLLQAVQEIQESGVAVIPWDGYRLRFTDATFPANFKQQQRSFLRADIVAPNGEGTNGIQAIGINGTPINNTIINFLATATPDVVTMSGWALRGAGGTNPLVASNFGAWFENNTNIVWVQEIDVNNEGATQSEGSHNGGVGVAINTGSTYSPNSAIDIRRYTGAGSGPGFLQGIVIAGVRNTAIRVEAMAAATYPGMSPAAPGSIDVIQALVSNDTNVRFRGSIGNANSGMRMEWGSGSAATDIFMERAGAGMLAVNSDVNSNVNAAYFGVWSAVSANNTPVGKVEFAGKNSAAAVKAYSTLISTIINNTAGAEDGMFQIWNRVAGTVTHVVDVQAGLIVGPTADGGDKGIGTVNVLNAYYTDGIKVVGARDTGWGAASNGSKVAFNGSTATLAQTSAAVAAIISALTTHGLLGA